MKIAGLSCFRNRKSIQTRTVSIHFVVFFFLFYYGGKIVSDASTGRRGCSGGGGGSVLYYYAAPLSSGMDAARDQRQADTVQPSSVQQSRNASGTPSPNCTLPKSRRGRRSGYRSPPSLAYPCAQQRLWGAGWDMTWRVAPNLGAAAERRRALNGARTPPRGKRRHGLLRTGGYICGASRVRGPVTSIAVGERSVAASLSHSASAWVGRKRDLEAPAPAFLRAGL